MPKTKIQHINKAFKHLRISGLTSKPSPSELEDALEDLEDMMFELNSRNICNSYNFEDEPNPNADSGISDSFNNATSTNLALRLSSGFGIQLLPELRSQAIQSMSNWSARTAKVNPIQPPNRQPRGSGNTFRFPQWWRFYRVSPESPNNCDTQELKVNGQDYFTVDFEDYLLEGATIVDYTVEPTNGIQVLEQAIDGSQITLKCKGLQLGSQTITITVTTSTDRINPEIVYFNIIR